MKLSTKWLTKGRIELLMEEEEEEEESLLRRAIAAIAISLSLSLGVVCARECLEFMKRFLFGGGEWVWVGWWVRLICKTYIIYVIGKRACLLGLSLSLSLFTCQVLLPIMWRHNRHPQQPTQYGVVLPPWAWKVGKSLKLNHNPMPHHE